MDGKLISLRLWKMAWREMSRWDSRWTRWSATESRSRAFQNFLTWRGLRRKKWDSCNNLVWSLFRTPPFLISAGVFLLCVQKGRERNPYDLPCCLRGVAYDVRVKITEYSTRSAGNVAQMRSISNYGNFHCFIADWFLGHADFVAWPQPNARKRSPSIILVRRPSITGRICWCCTPEIT